MATRPKPPKATRSSPSRRARALKLLVLDFDGVLTDNRVLVDESGRESVFCSRAEGPGLRRVQASGVEILVLSSEVNGVVAARCRKLGLKAIQGCEDKLPALQRLAADRGLAPHEIAYLGNDENDLECLEWVGFPAIVADAEPGVRKPRFHRTRRKGGFGAVREFCDQLSAWRV